MYKHYHHDSRNKLKHKVTACIYRHYKNAQTLMRKSSRGEKESGKEMVKDREQKKGRKKIK